MSYEKLRIGKRREIVKKSTGEIHNFLTVELLQPFDLYLNQDAIKQLSLFEKMEGEELLLEVTWGEYNGKPSLNIVGDGSPMRVPELLSFSSVDASTPASGKALFDKANRAPA